MAIRKGHELPAVTAKGWRYHHMGIPTDHHMPGEKYIKHLKMFVSGFEASPYGVEWMRFEEGCPISKLVRTVPHVAFVVDNIEIEIVGKQLLDEISEPSEGVRVAMIVENGAPIELLEFNNKL